MQKPLAADADGLDLLLGKFLRRYAYISLTNIESLSDQFARFIRATEVPRDPFHLLPHLGIALERKLLSPPSRAIWTRQDNRYIIYYSAHDRTASANFSLWHELFEILASHPQCPSALSPWLHERLANKFASFMLMPREAVLTQAARFRRNPEYLVTILSQRFLVSQTAMRKRLYELGIWKGQMR